MKRTISGLCLLSLFSSVDATIAKPKSDTPQHPNVIFILTDDLGYGDVGCLNQESKIATPNIDKLAHEGQLYSNAHASASVSTPSRYSCMTGRYAWRSRLKRGVIYGYDKPLIEPTRPTIATMLKNSGYNTACIGKWHLGLEWGTVDGKEVLSSGDNVDLTKEIMGGPIDRGFDYFYGLSASLNIPPFIIIENRKIYDKPPYTIVKKHGKPDYGHKGGLAVKGRGPEYFLPDFDRKAKETIEELSGKDAPFFLYYAMPAPHTPVAPSAEFRGKSDAGEYGDYVMQVDHSVGYLNQVIEDLGIEDDTLIIFSSDNGPASIAYARAEEYDHYSAGELKGIKRDLWEGGHRVPFIVKWGDKIKSDKIVDEGVCLSDIYATVADIVGHDLTQGEAEDSYSILPLMEGKRKFDRDHIIHHSTSGEFAIRKGDWVLIDETSGDDNKTSASKSYYEARGYDYELNRGELFNLRKDPREFVNLYDSNPKKVAELKIILERTKR